MILLNLFFTFMKIGMFTFGGGYAMIPLIEEFILKNNWATSNELIEFIGISESTPGPFAINISTFIGFKNMGFLGAVVSTVGVILPSIIIIILVGKFFLKIKNNNGVKFVLTQLRPIILSLLLFSILTIILKTFITNNTVNYLEMFVLILIISINLKFKLSPIKIILLSGVLGIVFL